jgi:hypothetical protein
VFVRIGARLSKFSPSVGDCLLPAVLLNITDVVHIFCGVHGKSFPLIETENVFGHILGDFSSSPSGHPVEK